MSFAELVKYFYWYLCRFCSRDKDRKLNKILLKAEKKIEKALDTRTLIKYQQTLASLKRLFLSNKSRKLLKLQRNETIIELKKARKHEELSSESSSSSEKSKTKALDKLQ